MAFDDIKTRQQFKEKICSQCNLCASAYKGDFCFPTFLPMRDKFMVGFVYKVLYDRGVSGDVALPKFRMPKTFKDLFCVKGGACLRGGGCSDGTQEICYEKFYQQVVGAKVKPPGSEEDDDMYYPGGSDQAWLDHLEEMDRLQEKAKQATKDAEEALEEYAGGSRVIDAEFTEINHKEPIIFSSERKAFLKAVEGILANRNSQQYRIRKSPKPLKAKIEGKTYNSKSSVSVSSKRRKKNVGNSETN